MSGAERSVVLIKLFEKAREISWHEFIHVFGDKEAAQRNGPMGSHTFVFGYDGRRKSRSALHVYISVHLRRREEQNTP